MRRDIVFTCLYLCCELLALVKSKTHPAICLGWVLRSLFSSALPIRLAHLLTRFGPRQQQRQPQQHVEMESMGFIDRSNCTAGQLVPLR
jgi:hypothetical protein